MWPNSSSNGPGREAAPAPVLEARGIVKSFPGVRALDGVDLEVRAGELRAVVGENGAGKSTLMNILAGVFRPDAGQLWLDGRPVRFASPREAQAAGIAIIFQELNLVPGLTVAQNLLLGREPRRRWGWLDERALNHRARALQAAVELNVPPETVVSRLRVGQQQLVEIAKALACQARVLILDEPTSAITEAEIANLFRLLLELKRQGVALLYITHKLDELPHLADQVTVLRDGRHITSGPLSQFGPGDLVRLMVGREVGEHRRSEANPRGAELLRVEHLSVPHPRRPGEWLLEDVTLRLGAGEVLGVFGLLGAGRTELLETLFGVRLGTPATALYVEGAAFRPRSPRDALARGLAFAPEDRKRDGLVLGMSVAHNTTLAALGVLGRGPRVDRAAEAACVRGYVERLGIKAAALAQPVRQLSGGNQQKIVLAKCLATAPKILLLDEPTRGIDVQAKQEIYALIEQLTRRGLGVLLVSSELPELLSVADRIMVLCEGRKTAEFPRREATEEKLLHAALPHRSTGPDALTQSG